MRPQSGREAGLGHVGAQAPHGRACSVSQGKLPVARRSVEVRPGTGREAGLGHGTGLKGFDWGFTGSWVYLLRHAVNTSMWAHPKHPCFVRSKEVHPTPGDLCESARRKFDWLPLLTFYIEATSFCCGCNPAMRPTHSLLEPRAIGPPKPVGWLLPLLYRVQRQTGQRG